MKAWGSVWKAHLFGFSPSLSEIVGATKVESILFDGSMTNACIKLFYGLGELWVQPKYRERGREGGFV